MPGKACNQLLIWAYHSTELFLLGQKDVHAHVHTQLCLPRCARKKDPDREPIMAWVDAADMMYSTGLEQYPESVFLHIAYANFLSTYKKSSAVSS